MATWYIGSRVSITWNPGDVPCNVRIRLSRDGGSTWEVVTASAPNTGSYAWTVTAPASATCLYEVSGLPYTDPVDGGVTDYTDMVVDSGIFAIAAAPSIVGRPSPRIAIFVGI
jgi:hypothetical protein